MTCNSLGGYFDVEYGELTGACPVCGLHYNGARHICPGPLTVNDQKEILGAQHVDDPVVHDYRTYGSRLDEGFALLIDSGWN